MSLMIQNAIGWLNAIKFITVGGQTNHKGLDISFFFNEYHTVQLIILNLIIFLYFLSVTILKKLFFLKKKLFVYVFHIHTNF